MWMAVEMVRRRGGDNEPSQQRLAALRAGDADAQLEFVRLYADRVFAFCFRMLNDAAAAGDALQDTLIEALQNLPRYDEQRGRLSSWLYGIATHRCLDARRRRARVVRLSEHIAKQGVATGAAALPDAAVVAQEQRSRVNAAIAALPDDLRAVVVLRAFAECSVDETASVLGIAAGTVKSRLSRAKDALSHILGSHP
jgi:RNA polymerase sigma factor (sigma-70 family)